VLPLWEAVAGMSQWTRAFDIPDWTEEALCAQTDPAAFFRDSGRCTEAKAVCNACPVREQCLEWALAYESGEMAGANYAACFGVYGGLTGIERRRIIRKRRAAELKEAS
jgi:WhiB family redox-sensing transcriptional regulator